MVANAAGAQTVAADPAVDAKAAKAAAKAEAQRVKELQRRYGLGPYPEEIDAYVASKPETLRPYYKTLYTGGERNAVLNFQRLGLAAIKDGNWKEAEWAFDRALDRIEAIFGENEQAKAARSVFKSESNKNFKGEPYERSMAYYYRGLLYLRAGDFGNARATFKSAEYQDTLSEHETFQSDFAVMNYLIGWTFFCEGQAASAAEAFAVATTTNESLVAPKAGDNMLFLAELGNGPVKERDGAQAQKLIFKAGPEYEERVAHVRILDKWVPLTEASSVYYQATTRGGRGIDGIMNGKAAFKTGTETAAQISMGVAQSFASQGDAGGALVGMGIGLAFSLLGGAAKTRADTRAWDGLPDLIMVGSAKVPATYKHSVQYLSNGAPVTVSGPVMQGGNKTCGISWSRSRDYQLPEAVVGDDENVAKSVRLKRPVQEKDRAFRASLTA